MSYVLEGAASPIATPVRVSRLRLVATWRTRRRVGKEPHPRYREPSGSTIGPFACAASRGVVFLIRR